MAERKRSKDGSSDTEKFVDDAVETPSQGGRSDGNLERNVGTRDEGRQAEHGEGTTRVTKSDEEGDGNLGGLHGTGEDDDGKGS
ncbi:hypothetical protein SAMN04488020_11063 [Palleronia marisminoris]|uniref:Uncharacterized protein n=1 Tax=Palleronia marisminoris TaxID=315423 RepID=A0A1Y5TCS7_9RHOB|nr:hypothetical protein [Palleronia marisminoris]SFH33039.1 hypothetical protein SAMN04488020_11063 [Palleronia marisminoris]SLN60758.1 hypothetical protein PAM7066_03015 [Palleronia marisminoris]